jgi:hypothetical protein
MAVFSGQEVEVATELQTQPVFDALRQPLALIESEERRKGIETYVEAARTPLERAVYDLMSQMATAIDEKVAEHYRIRLSYQPGGLAVEVEEKVAANGADEAQWSATEGDVEKITIRIPAELKDLAQQAAGRAGTSANSWFVKALARAVRNMDAQPAPPPPGRWQAERKHGRGSRISGWLGGEDDI